MPAPGPYVQGVPYANLADFQSTGIPPTALTGKTDDDINAALLNASDIISGSMASQFTPLSAAAVPVPRRKAPKAIPRTIATRVNARRMFM